MTILLKKSFFVWALSLLGGLLLIWAVDALTLINGDREAQASAGGSEAVVGSPLLGGYEQRDTVVKLKLTDQEEASQVRLLSDILDKGVADKMVFLSSASLSGFEGYRSIILPRLKSRALANAVARMRQSDWQDGDGVVGSGSPVDLYLSGIRPFNPELFDFVDRTLIVFKHFYRFANGGRLSEVNDIRYLAASALAHSPSGPGVEALVADPVFQWAFERIAPLIICERFKRVELDLYEDYRALSYLDAGETSQEVYQTVRRLLMRISVDNSASVRQKILSKDRQERVLLSFGMKDRQARRLLAGAYLVGTLDALKRGDRVLARVFYDESVRIHPGLPSQLRLWNRFSSSDMS